MAATAFLLLGAYGCHPVLGIAVETVMTYQILAAKCLKTESMKVYKCLKDKNINEARTALSMIVGRDTQALNEEGIIKAAVETVAENTSDGVTAPMVNYIPSRISAYLMITAAYIGGDVFSGKSARYIYKRDRHNHASPNSAQTESVCAGALGVRLAGDASYFGHIVRKPYIGDELRKAEYEDIRRANRLMYLTAWLGEFICLCLMTAVCMFCERM